MKIAILGATGWIGGAILKEALSRGHQVTALVRDPSKLSATDVAVHAVDLEQPLVAQTFAGVDVVIAAVGGRAQQNHDLVASTVQHLLDVLPNAKVPRLLWVGGAGSLEVAPGVTLVSSPDFPAAYKDEALAQGEALQVFRAAQTAINWTFVSPAAEIYPGESEGPYRLGGDSFFTDANGRSRISVTDYAKAMLDEAEQGTHANQRISVAY
ncbi:NAD(P)-dependent oxidoreductase [Shewanella baltica]|uniref:NAD-dependent epimerase/dehydratase n=2 Tax=Shewanella baltica TaxID=62322 RepID=A9L342_SHEB9|nr:NAD(P)-dependent oxidoreductase [Shewanella baltica]ABN60136.1 NAD-dependent epimerase/dehydratase [Shewanella baltica OS155]ABX50971.1 NAD-dependent epimerase/dehydratase [Shewanella baltica OS195]ADT95972.1 NAD-dependent epimerase/dehydratase [Shewanella baltica OS678]AEH12530.1 NAD-dependent epimerase/dehydratase [Shewanella baltica OS117]EHC08026.1 NAD-dependent epimerase/dehydratase [Shewanella baltica OS625]